MIAEQSFEAWTSTKARTASGVFGKDDSVNYNLDYYCQNLVHLMKGDSRREVAGVPRVKSENQQKSDAPRAVRNFQKNQQ